MTVKIFISGGPQTAADWCCDNISPEPVPGNITGFSGDGWSIGLKYAPELLDENGFIRWAVTFDKEEHATMFILSGVGNG